MTEHAVIIVAKCPVTGAYEVDEPQTVIGLDAGDDVRLRFDGETLTLEDFKPVAGGRYLTRIAAICRLHTEHPASTAADKGSARLAEKVLGILEEEP